MEEEWEAWKWEIKENRLKRKRVMKEGWKQPPASLMHGADGEGEDEVEKMWEGRGGVGRQEKGEPARAEDTTLTHEDEEP